MKKKILTAFTLFFACTFFSFAEGAPIASGGWHWNEGKTLNGRFFGSYEVAESYREQDGWAVLDMGSLGKTPAHFWLYDTYTYYNGYGDFIRNRAVPNWVESMGYIIDFDHMGTGKEEKESNIFPSLRALMKQRGCDVAVWLQLPGNGLAIVWIFNYDKAKDKWFCDMIPLF